MNKIIKVLIVDDSLFFRKLLMDKLSDYKNIEIIGYAVDAYDANEKIPLLKPDVVTLDVEMPKLNGMEFLKQILPKHSIPFVLVSSVNMNVFEALSAGAVDFVKKPDISKPGNITVFMDELASKITIASYAKIHPGLRTNTIIPSNLNYGIKNNSAFLNSMIIAIGASTGGPEAILAVLENLPHNSPGILIVQHMPPGFTKMFAERLNRLCKIEVKEAENGDIVKNGLALLAPGDFHMALARQGNNYVVKLYHSEKVSGHRPSVDVLFSSVAEVAKKNAIGVILTGMGKDGAEGLLKMKKEGAYTIGQDKESCVVYGMPMVAYNIGAVSTQAPCQKIAPLIEKRLSDM